MKHRPTAAVAVIGATVAAWLVFRLVGFDAVRGLQPLIGDLAYRTGLDLTLLRALGLLPADLELVEGIVKVICWVLPAAVLARFAADHWGEALDRLGIRRMAVGGVLLGLAASLPMLLAMLDEVRRAIDLMLSYTGQLPRFQPAALIGTALLGPLAEEVLFRGLLVGHLISAGGWRPRTAVLFSAIAFALAHAIGDRVPVPILVSLLAGGALFGWLFVRWGSIWPAVSLHALINFFWVASPSTVGIWQAVSMALAVLITWWLQRPSHKQHGPDD